MLCTVIDTHLRELYITHSSFLSASEVANLTMRLSCCLVVLAWLSDRHVYSFTSSLFGGGKHSLQGFCAAKSLPPSAEHFGKLVPASPGTERRANLHSLVRLTVLGASLLGVQAARASQPISQPSLCNTQTLEDALRGNALLDNVVQTKPGDERKYRPLTLPNGLRVLLISDPASSRSAAALDVHVGSFSDPEEVPGLAHFCEHMSFLGTEKYPEEGDFATFLASHGGSSNAYTDNEDTVYYFDVNADFLQEALDRFAQFFIAPLFTASATARELNAIDR